MGNDGRMGNNGMDGCGVVDGGGMVRGGAVGGGVGRRVGLARVGDVGDIPRVLVVHVVGHGLDAAVGQGHVVLALHSVAVPLLAVAEVGAGVLVVDAVLEGVVGRLVVVGLGMVGPVVGAGRSDGSHAGSHGSDLRGGGSHGGGDKEGSNDEGLKNMSFE